MLCEEVRGIGRAVDLPEVNPPVPHCLLYPQQVRIEMAKLTETLAAADADRCRRVRPDAELQPVPQVGHQALEAETHPSAADGPVELGFS